jgi:hypothetical protein
MLVHRADFTESERQAFEQAIRASGRDPGTFKAELFEATLLELGRTLRRAVTREYAEPGRELSPPLKLPDEAPRPPASPRPRPARAGPSAPLPA